MNLLVWLAVSGACGTLARYGVTYACTRVMPQWLFLGTTLANTLGCFLFGFIWMLTERWSEHVYETRLVILVGFMGAFTTFSSLIFEGSQFVRAADWLRLLLHIGGGVVAGFAALALGIVLAHYMFPR